MYWKEYWCTANRPERSVYIVVVVVVLLPHCISNNVIFYICSTSLMAQVDICTWWCCLYIYNSIVSNYHFQISNSKSNWISTIQISISILYSWPTVCVQSCIYVFLTFYLYSVIMYLYFLLFLFNWKNWWYLSSVS